MSDHDATLDDLYQEILLDHHRSPRREGLCPDCGLRAHRDNPLCGDEITLGLEVEGDTIAHVSQVGKGCAISRASASMMAEAIAGQPVRRAMELVETVRRMLRGEAPDEDGEDLEGLEDLGDLAALEGVARFPARIRCALLPWEALEEALARPL